MGHTKFWDVQYEKIRVKYVFFVLYSRMVGEGVQVAGGGCVRVPLCPNLQPLPPSLHPLPSTHIIHNAQGERSRMGPCHSAGKEEFWGGGLQSILKYFVWTFAIL